MIRERWIGLVVCLIIAFLLVMVEAHGQFKLQSIETTKTPICIDEINRERIRGLMLDALDEALKTRVEHLYETWLRDDTGQPGRAATGARLAINAYARARVSMIEWDPPAC